MKIKSESQFGQDEIVLEILKYKNSGFFVDIGANDGKTLSNTYAMEKELGWSGICVEADSRVIPELKENRDCYIETSPISPQSGMDIRFYENDDSMLSMTVWGNAYLQNPDGSRISEEDYRILKSISINDLLEKYNAPKSIDYISMDVEGIEPFILKSFDFNRYDVGCWSIEWKNASGIVNNDNKFFMTELLFNNGYAIMQKQTDLIAWR